MSRCLVTLGALALLTQHGCLGDLGERCQLDSDCGGGLVCGESGTCETFASVQASFDVAPSSDSDAGTCSPQIISDGCGSDDDATDAADTIADTSAVSCEPRAGVFDEGSPPCPAPREKKKVTGIALVPAGHGLSKMAEIANNVLADGFDKGDIQLSLWVDGTYAPGCDAHFVFVEDPTTDILDDCTPRYVDAMPLVIPGLVRTEVFGVSVDPATNTVTGLVDEAALIASMDPALHEIADNLIDLDVDTECDGTADKASAILTLTFE